MCMQSSGLPVVYKSWPWPNNLAFTELMSLKQLSTIAIICSASLHHIHYLHEVYTSCRWRCRCCVLALYFINVLRVKSRVLTFIQMIHCTLHTTNMQVCLGISMVVSSSCSCGTQRVAIPSTTSPLLAVESLSPWNACYPLNQWP